MISNWCGGICYEIFFMLLAFLAIPARIAIMPIAVSVCVSTSALEFLQLWQPGWLMSIRSTVLGQLLLGSTFAWQDFPVYIVGCVLGWFVLRMLHIKSLPAGRDH